MHTRTIRITNLAKQQQEIIAAATLLARGELVAFPTETVYGLGANALDEAAVRQIFAAKDRPADNPLIVHVTNTIPLTGIVSEIPPAAQLLMNTFWPGPLSLVLPKHRDLPSVTTGGLDTVVVRFPSHPVARALITAAKLPIAAPSANTSGKPSPTTATHVKADLDGKIPLIIDAGPVAVGLESTVVDCTTDTLTILRPGAVTSEMLRIVIPDIATSTAGDTMRSPGMKYRHYAPATPVVLFRGQPTDTTTAMHQFLLHHERAAIMWHDGDFAHYKTQIQLPKDPVAAATKIFASLRTLDEQRPSHILVQGYDEDGIGAAIMNRLEKAASQTISV